MLLDTLSLSIPWRSSCFLVFRHLIELPREWSLPGVGSPWIERSWPSTALVCITTCSRLYFTHFLKRVSVNRAYPNRCHNALWHSRFWRLWSAISQKFQRLSFPNCTSDRINFKFMLSFFTMYFFLIFNTMSEDSEDVFCFLIDAQGNNLFVNIFYVRFVGILHMDWVSQDSIRFSERVFWHHFSYLKKIYFIKTVVTAVSLDWHLSTDTRRV